MEEFMDLLKIIALAAIAILGLAGSTLASATPKQAHQTYRDPIAYCRAVGMSNGPPDRRYKGPESVPWIERAVRWSKGDPGYVSWGCDNRRVVACVNGGITGPCEKVDMSRTTNSDTIAYCRSHPNDELAAALTGHYTAYDWHCLHGRPTIRRQMTIPDHRGYVPGDYDPVSLH